MNKIYDTYRPEGFGTVNPYIFADNPRVLIEFLTNASKGIETGRTDGLLILKMETLQIAS